MKDNDYEKAKNLLRQIDSISSQVDLIKEQWSELMAHNGKAKLFIYANGKSYETVLTEDTVAITMSAILKQYREYIKSAHDELNKIIAQVTPVE
ncbi:hypothetical protein [uncultured Bacteroides sp.]|uniref:hypothetical protein n=1 Tax=uncultured Bacteroides sp. TaxID=162156 RepID=UPI00259780E0|nr:hypothetical protein [uncultured Bacteroides sp.]